MDILITLLQCIAASLMIGSPLISLILGLALRDADKSVTAPDYYLIVLGICFGAGAFLLLISWWLKISPESFLYTITLICITFILYVLGKIVKKIMRAWNPVSKIKLLFKRVYKF